MFKYQDQISYTSNINPGRDMMLQRKCGCGGSAEHGSECAECKKKKETTLQRHATGRDTPATAPPIVHEVLRSPGRPLDAATRSFFEPRFGHDFSKVRIHADAQAAESARSVNALAYTVGQDVVFGGGQYSPNSAAGQRLLAHELTHTIQQAQGAAFVGSSPDESRLEREADTASRAALEGNGAKVSSNAALSLSRQPATSAAPTPAVSAPASTATTDPSTIDGFVTGSAEISAFNMVKLRVIADRINAALKIKPDMPVKVIGHTDAQGNEIDNQALGERRAKATRDTLLKMGVPEKVLHEPESKGQTEPVDKSGKKDSPQNRRVEVKFDAPPTPATPASPQAEPYDPQSPDAPKSPQASDLWCLLHPESELCKVLPKSPPAPTTPPPQPEPPVPDWFNFDPGPVPKGAKPKTLKRVIRRGFKDLQKRVNNLFAPILNKLSPKGQDFLRGLIQNALTKGALEPLRQGMKALGLSDEDQKTIQDNVNKMLNEDGDDDEE